MQELALCPAVGQHPEVLHSSLILDGIFITQHRAASDVVILCGLCAVTALQNEHERDSCPWRRHLELYNKPCITPDSCNRNLPSSVNLDVIPSLQQCLQLKILATWHLEVQQRDTNICTAAA